MIRSSNILGSDILRAGKLVTDTGRKLTKYQHT